MSDELAPIEGQIVAVEQGVPFGAMMMRTPADVVQRAVEVANVLKDIVMKNNLSVNIQGRAHVKAEGWSTLGGMLGITVQERVDLSYRFDDGTWRSTVELVRGSDGAIVGRATALCSPAEDRWRGKPEYAIQSMSLTRATGKAFRLSFSWIMTIAGYAPTPAEEMDGIYPQQDNEGYSKPKPKAAQDAASALPRREAVSAPTNGAGLAFPPLDAVIGQLDGQSLYMLQNEGWKHCNMDNAFHYKNRWKKIYVVTNIRDIPGTVGDFIERMKQPSDFEAAGPDMGDGDNMYVGS